MPRSVTLLLVLALSAPACLHAYSDYQITFRTRECSGDTGMATVAISDIYKIQSVECEPPDEKVKLKQVLVRSRTLRSSYDVFTVDEESAEMIMKEIDSYMKARKRTLENSDSIILHNIRE